MVPALTPGPGVVGDMAAVAGGVRVEAGSMAEGGAEAFAAATAVEAFVVMVEAASAVVTEVIEVVTVDGDMDAVTATEAVGDRGLASG
ncbi:MAG TPA: hypothetical protein VKO18_09925 [Terriglobia bacterium]|nr:hypothetical protein [Terriglobia bacterium]